MKEISSAVDGFSTSDTLLKEAPSRDSRKKARKKRSYVERLAFTHVLPNSHEFTIAELNRLTGMNLEEQKWRISFFDFLIGSGLLPELKTLPLEELREFIFMKKDEQKHWVDKLAERKAHGAQEPTPQGQPADWREVRARMSKLNKDETASMEVRMLPQVREDVNALAATKGMASAEYVEHLIVDTINANQDLVKQGEEILKRFGGNLTRVKRHVQAEKLARLEALEASLSSRSR
jgi:hypothetical protein